MARPPTSPWPRGGRRRRRCRTKPRHTTRLEGLPDSVRVTRRRHPFEGQTLAVLGGMHRHGVLELLVVLGDGSKSLMPMDWTDVAATDTSAASATLGSLRDLLRAVTVVAALLPAVAAGGFDAGGQSSQEAAEVCPRSARPGSARRGGGLAERAGGVKRSRSGRRDKGFDPVDGQGDRARAGRRGGGQR